MSNFQPGDKVLINGTQVAEIEFYDEDLNLVRYVTKANSSTNVTTAHVSQTQIQHLVSDVVASDEAPVVAPVEEPVEEQE